MTLKDTLQQNLDDLDRERDELKVQLHLAGMEAKDSWEELEHKWENIAHKMTLASDQAIKSSENIETAIGLIADEIKSGYQKIRRSLH